MGLLSRITTSRLRHHAAPPLAASTKARENSRAFASVAPQDASRVLPPAPGGPGLSAEQVMRQWGLTDVPAPERSAAAAILDTMQPADRYDLVNLGQQVDAARQRGGGPRTRTTSARTCRLLREILALPQALQQRMLAAIQSLPHWQLEAVVECVQPHLGKVVSSDWQNFLAAAHRLCGFNSLNNQRSICIHTLLAIHPNDWQSFARAAEQLCTGLAQDTRGRVVSMLGCAWGITPDAERVDFVSHAARLCSRSMAADSRAQIITGMMHLSAQERPDFTALCEPLRPLPIEPAQVAVYICLLADTPERERRSHLTRLMERYPGDDAGPKPVDRENVSVYQRINKTADSIAALQGALQPPATRVMLDNIAAYISRLMRGRIEVPEALLRFRAGRMELENAMRTLRGDRMPGDYCGSLRENQPLRQTERDMGLGDLAALIWHAIDVYESPEPDSDAQDNASPLLAQQNLRISLVTALAQCIEDDGHRVCAVGISQRLMTVLQGYYPGVHLDTVTPQTLLCELSREFEASLPMGATAGPGDVAAFYARAGRVAQTHYGRNGPEVETFTRDLQAYLSMEYNWRLAA